MGNLAIINKFDLLPEEIETIFAQQDSGSGTPIRYSSTDKKSALFNSCNGGGESITKIFDEVVTVTDIVITSAEVPVDRNKPDGPKVSRPCVNFFCDDGRHFASLSNGVVRATKNILGCGFIPTEQYPINLSFYEINTPKGKAHTFDLVDLEETDEGVIDV